MAQVFALAETMYASAGRNNAQSAFQVSTNGKPSFQSQTNELPDDHVHSWKLRAITGSRPSTTLPFVNAHSRDGVSLELVMCVTAHAASC